MVVTANLEANHSRRNIMEDIIFEDKRLSGFYIDRRSGEDRRKVYDLAYWESGGKERRYAKERRQQKERRSRWVNVSEWSSICLENNTD